MVELLPDAQAARSEQRLRRLRNHDAAALVALCADDPVTHCFPLSRISMSLAQNSATSFWGWFSSQDVLESALYVGANVVPIATTRISRLAFADRLLRQSPRCSSFVGPAAEVLDLWSLVEDSWGKPREIRSTQNLLSCSQRVRNVPRMKIRPVAVDELDLLLPACIAMFTEEVGISPAAGGMAASYEARVRELIQLGRALAFIDNGEVIFKAEIGAIANGACQVQGVWVNPDYRGRGIGTAGMASVVDHALREFSDVVSLYVNDFNEPACRAYERVGFTHHGTFATVLR